MDKWRSVTMRAYPGLPEMYLVVYVTRKYLRHVKEAFFLKSCF